MTPPKPSANRYRTARDIVVPKGQIVVFVSKMRKEIERTALAVVNAGPDTQYEWTMYFDDALRSGLIEEVPK